MNKTRLEKAYKDWKPETYNINKLDIGHWLTSPWITEIIRLTKLPKKAKVCEFGCGCGKFSAAFAILGCKVTCVDIMPEMLEKVKENFPNIKMEFIQADIVNPDPKKFAWGTYDLAINEGVIEHFPTRKQRVKALNTMTKLCKKGGHVAVFVPGNYSKKEYHYTHETLKKEIQQAGLKEIIQGNYGFKVDYAAAKNGKQVKGKRTCLLGIGVREK